MAYPGAWLIGVTAFAGRLSLGLCARRRTRCGNAGPCGCHPSRIRLFVCAPARLVAGLGGVSALADRLSAGLGASWRTRCGGCGSERPHALPICPSVCVMAHTKCGMESESDWIRSLSPGRVCAGTHGMWNGPRLDLPAVYRVCCVYAGAYTQQTRGSRMRGFHPLFAALSCNPLTFTRADLGPHRPRHQRIEKPARPSGGRPCRRPCGPRRSQAPPDASPAPLA